MSKIVLKYPTLYTGRARFKYPKCPGQSPKPPWHVAHEQLLFAGPYIPQKTNLCKNILYLPYKRKATKGTIIYIANKPSSIAIALLSF